MRNQGKTVLAMIKRFFGKIYKEEILVPVPECCPFFLECDRNAVGLRNGGKELERNGGPGQKFRSFIILILCTILLSR